MKQLIVQNPIFDPVNKTLDFSNIPNFNVDKLYSVINVTRNTPIYVTGAPGLGAASQTYGVGGLQNGLTKIVLTFDTSLHASSDSLNVYYDTAPGAEANTPTEFNGQMQMMQESLDLILTELKVLNNILIQGLNISTIGLDDVITIRNDVAQILNYPSNH